MKERFSLFFGFAVALAATSGCGGGSSSGNSGGGGASLATQYNQARAMASPQSRADALIRVGYKQYKAGDSSGANSSYREAMEAVAEVEDPYQRATVEALLASAYAKSNNKIEAAKVLKSAVASAEKISSVENKIDAQSRIAGVYGADLQEPGNATGKLKEAEGLSDGIADPNDRLIALAAIIRGYHKSNKSADVDRLIGKAGEVSAGIDDPRKKADALVTMGRSMVDADRKDEGTARLNAAIAAAKQIDQLRGKVHVLTTIVAELTHAGSNDASRSLFVETEAMAKGIPEADLRKQALDRLHQVANSPNFAKSK